VIQAEDGQVAKMSPMLRAALCLIAPLTCFAASTIPPEGDQRLAHDIYKEMARQESPQSDRCRAMPQRGWQRRNGEGKRISNFNW
jgi:hypothetical protein